MDDINRIDLIDIKMKKGRNFPNWLKDTNIRIVRKSLTSVKKDIKNLTSHRWEEKNGYDSCQLKCECGDIIKLSKESPYVEDAMLQYLRREEVKRHPGERFKVGKTRKCTFTEEDWIVKDIIV